MAAPGPDRMLAGMLSTQISRPSLAASGPRPGAAIHLLALLILGIPMPTQASDTATDPLITVAVEADFATSLPGPLHLGGYVNFTRRVPPPAALFPLVADRFGRSVIARAWLTLDEAWDYRSDEYRFDYELNRDYYAEDPGKSPVGAKGVPDGSRFYPYLEGVARDTDAVMLNVRRYEQDVLRGRLAIGRWKEAFKTLVGHYRERCPKLRYIEVLNEPTARNQSNLGTMANYLTFYRPACAAIAELNAERRLDPPLLVGGPSGHRPAEAIHLIRALGKERDQGLRLDFLSFHHYWMQEEPAQVAGWEEQIRGELGKTGLPVEIPIFVSEIGYASEEKKDRADRNLWQACGMTACQFQARRARNLRLFPWVTWHSEKQVGYVQFDTRLRLTPFGAATRLLGMHRGAEFAARSTGLDGKGNGTGVLVTGDEGGLSVQLWNLRPDGRSRAQVTATLRNLPPAWRGGGLALRRYLIDTTHSNCFAPGADDPGLEEVERRTVKAGSELVLEAALEPMAITLWRLEPAPRE